MNACASVWTMLDDLDEEDLWRGRVFRSLPSGAGEGPVDRMLVHGLWRRDERMGLVVTTGRQAGSGGIAIPSEAGRQGAVCVRRDWMLANWAGLTGAGCRADRVLTRPCYDIDVEQDAAQAGWTRLVDATGAALPVGCVLRCPAQWPYEDTVDFMVIDQPSGERRYALLVATGYKAGHLLLQVPQQAQAADGAGLRTRWVVERWAEWIYPECAVGDVFVRGGYDTELWPNS